MNLKISLIFIAFLFSSAFVIDTKPLDPKKIYKSNCRICHGAKGKLGINGATNLAKSTFSKSEIAQVITEGRGVMTPFKDILDKDEIKAVAKYVKSLQK